MSPILGFPGTSTIDKEVHVGDGNGNHVGITDNCIRFVSLLQRSKCVRRKRGLCVLNTLQ